MSAGESPSERFMVAPELGGLSTITLVQRAICRIADGWSLTSEMRKSTEVLEMCGGEFPPSTRVPPALLMLICAIRTGKSQLAAGFALRMALTVDLSGVRENEPTPRIAVLSTDKDNARVVYEWIEGTVARGALAGDLVRKTRESITLRREDGREIEIVVVAGAREGTTLVGRWLAGVIFDECTLMLGGDDSVIDLADSIRQTEGRLLPGAQVIMIGSTTAPPRGPAYDLLHAAFGRPTADRVALWTTGPDMAPFRYTPAYCKKLAASNPTLHRVSTTRTFLDPETTFLSAEAVDRARRFSPQDIPPEPSGQYVAATDPASRHNGWTLVVLEAMAGALPVKYRVALQREWRATAGERLSPRVVVGQIAEHVRPYGVDTIYSDMHMADSLSDLADPLGLVWVSEMMQQQQSRDLHFLLEQLLQDELLELPPSGTMRDDLVSIKKRITPLGVTFHLAKSANGRHGDNVPSLLRALAHRPDAMAVEVHPEEDEMARFWSRHLDGMSRSEGDPMGARMRRLLA